jgi:hypothetical protein
MEIIMSFLNKNKIDERFRSLILISVIFLPFTVDRALAQSQESALPSSAARTSAFETKKIVEPQTFEEKIKSFNDKSTRFQLVFLNTATSIVSSYSEGEERSQWVDQLKQIKTTTDAKEQAALIKKALPQLSKEVQRLINGTDFSDRTQRLSPESRNELRALMPSFIILTLQAKGIMELGNSIVKSATEAPVDQLSKVLQIRIATMELASSTSLLPGMTQIILAVNKIQ